LYYTTYKFFELLVKINNGTQIYNVHYKSEHTAAVYKAGGLLCCWTRCSKGWNTWILVLATTSALIFVLLLKCFVSDCPFIAEMNDASLTNG